MDRFSVFMTGFLFGFLLSVLLLEIGVMRAS